MSWWTVFKNYSENELAAELIARVPHISSQCSKDEVAAYKTRFPKLFAFYYEHVATDINTTLKSLSWKNYEFNFSFLVKKKRRGLIQRIITYFKVFKENKITEESSGLGYLMKETGNIFVWARVITITTTLMLMICLSKWFRSLRYKDDDSLMFRKENNYFLRKSRQFFNNKIVTLKNLITYLWL